MTPDVLTLFLSKRGGWPSKFFEKLENGLNNFLAMG
jgi:hypothetical protein